MTSMQNCAVRHLTSRFCVKFSSVNGKEKISLLELSKVAEITINPTYKEVKKNVLRTIVESDLLAQVYPAKRSPHNFHGLVYVSHTRLF